MEIVRSGIAAILVPVFFLYILIDKPDYKILNAASYVVVPVAQTVGDGVSWPFRIVGKVADGTLRHLNATNANRDLRRKLDAALTDAAEIDILRAENQRLAKILNFSQSIPHKTILARVTRDHSILSNNILILDRGESSGIRPGMVAISTTGHLVGIVTEVTAIGAKVRGLEDMKSNIPVRVAGSGVYGFLRGDGASAPVFEFFSDTEFRPTAGIRLVTSGINGQLPNDIPVGTVIDENARAARVKIGAPTSSVHEVLVLEFDKNDRYK